MRHNEKGRYLQEEEKVASLRSFHPRNEKDD